MFQISKHHICFDVHVVQTSEIREVQPAYVRVYDYYEHQGIIPFPLKRKLLPIVIG